MQFYITVNDVVYSLCIKAHKDSLTRLKVTATITWFEKNRTLKGSKQSSDAKLMRPVLQPVVRKRHTPNLLSLFKGMTSRATGLNGN